MFKPIYALISLIITPNTSISFHFILNFTIPISILHSSFNTSVTQFLTSNLHLKFPIPLDIPEHHLTIPIFMCADVLSPIHLNLLSPFETCYFPLNLISFQTHDHHLSSQSPFKTFNLHLVTLISFSDFKFAFSNNNLHKDFQSPFKIFNLHLRLSISI